MQLVQYYLADDGTKFDDEEECLDYEAELRAKSFKDTAFFLDENGRKLPLNREGFDEAIFMKAITDAAAQFLAEDLIDPLPWRFGEAPKAGAWVWMDNRWVSIGEIEKMYKILRENL